MDILTAVAGLNKALTAKVAQNQHRSGDFKAKLSKELGDEVDRIRSDFSAEKKQLSSLMKRKVDEIGGKIESKSQKAVIFLRIT